MRLGILLVNLLIFLVEEVLPLDKLIGVSDVLVELGGVLEELFIVLELF